MTRWLAAGVLLLAATGITWAAPPETPLLQNGDFEQGIAGWRVLNLSGEALFEPDMKVRHSGKQSLRIEKNGPGQQDWLKQSASLPMGVKEVRAVCWFKVDKGARAEVTVYFFDGADATIGKGDVYLVNSGPNRKWEKAEERLDVPEGAVGVGVNVRVAAKGTFWLDGFEVSYGGGGAPGLANGGFEDGLTGWRPLEFGTQTTQASADRSVRAAGKTSARLQRTNPRLLVEDGLYAEVAAGPGKQTLRFQARSEGGARAAVALQAFDARGVSTSTVRTVAGGDAERFLEGDLVFAAPPETRRIGVSLIVVGAGTVWFDDVSLSASKEK